MIELGTGTTPADKAASDLIQDVTEATFMQEVIEASKTVAVIVDFGRRGAGRVKHWFYNWKRPSPLPKAR